ncbi:hypothetical protein SALB1_1915 [Salinisphaera sp. LB1]|nr:hypothetical protein SALB1_1915 [Salinisphaera sp. LB1]
MRRAPATEAARRAIAKRRNGQPGSIPSWQRHKQAPHDY